MMHVVMTMISIHCLRRTLDKRRYGLEFSPVTVQDSGTYYCFINNRLDSSPVELIVQDAPEPPPHRPMISSISSRSRHFAADYGSQFFCQVCAADLGGASQ